MIEGNYPPPQGGVVHNNQSIVVPEEIVRVSEGVGGGSLCKCGGARELVAAYAIINGRQSHGLCKYGGRKDGDCSIISTGEGEVWVM